MADSVIYSDKDTVMLELAVQAVTPTHPNSYGQTQDTHRPSGGTLNDL